MYRLINQNIDQLLAAISYDRDVQPYVWLIRNLVGANVATSAEYQRVYRRYWQLNSARLSEDFCQSYFALLEELKQASNANVETVARRLLEVPTHGNGRVSLQFSFGSKLVHMLNQHLPVYDSMVKDFYFLPTGPAKEKTEVKLKRLLTSYEFLVAEYTRVLRNGILGDSIERFRQKFHLGPEYSDSKVIDTLIWRFVSFLRNGAVRNINVVYG
ncbi:MAG: hypothetical protein NT096_05795 [Proteobacteria bacterium]|nr:hypothetical protein [Pseudomonadota bacterium]